MPYHQFSLSRARYFFIKKYILCCVFFYIIYVRIICRKISWYSLLLRAALNVTTAITTAINVLNAFLVNLLNDVILIFQNIPGCNK